MILLFLVITLVTASTPSKQMIDQDEIGPEGQEAFNTSEKNQSVEMSKLSGVGEVDTVGMFTFVVEGIFLTSTAIVGIFCNSFAILLIVRSFSEDPSDAESSTYQARALYFREVSTRTFVSLFIY